MRSAAQDRWEYPGDGKNGAEQVCDYRKPVVLLDHTKSLTTQMTNKYDTFQSAVDEGRISGFESGFHSPGAHSYSYIGLSKCGSVIDAISHHSHDEAFSLKLSYVLGFVTG